MATKIATKRKISTKVAEVKPICRRKGTKRKKAKIIVNAAKIQKAIATSPIASIPNWAKVLTAKRLCEISQKPNLFQ